MEPRKYTGRRTPQFSANQLGEYMIASEVRKRRIIAEAKYRPILKVISYKKARRMLSDYLEKGRGNLSFLENTILFLSEKTLAGRSLEETERDLTVQMLGRFIAVSNEVNLPNAQYALGSHLAGKLMLGGLPVSVVPNLVATGQNRKGQQTVGAVMIRYAKGKPLNPDEAKHVSVLLYEFAKGVLSGAGVAAYNLCFCLDIQTGKIHCSPKGTTRVLSNMAAAGEAIIAQWPSVPLPRSLA